eukprot:4889168-Amphidinium_carterae.1
MTCSLLGAPFAIMQQVACLSAACDVAQEPQERICGFRATHERQLASPVENYRAPRGKIVALVPHKPPTWYVPVEPGALVASIYATKRLCVEELLMLPCFQHNDGEACCRVLYGYGFVNVTEDFPASISLAPGGLSIS